MEAAAATLIDVDEPGKGAIKIRVGFHSGPVVASLISGKYTLLGDSMNIASRMESNGEPGRVNLSAAAQKLLQAQAPAVAVESRGKVDIKGKGKIECFFLSTSEEALAETLAVRLAPPNLAPTHSMDSKSFSTGDALEEFRRSFDAVGEITSSQNEAGRT